MENTNNISLLKLLEKYRSSNYGYKLPIPLGIDDENHIRFTDLTKIKHILTTGMTGSGKSVFENMIVSFLISLFSPKEIKFLIFDLKRVEFFYYNKIPNLLSDVIVDVDSAFKGIEDLITEKKTRLTSNKPIEEYPYIVVIIDAFANWIYSDKSRFEDLFKSLIDDSDKAKIHVIVGDSRCSTDIISPNFKSLFPTKICFQVHDEIASKDFLNISGAEELLSPGSMLLLEENSQIPVRIQGSMITENEVVELIDKLKK